MDSNTALSGDQLEKELLTACGLSLSEFSSFASNLESLQKLHAVCESLAFKEQAQSEPLIEIAKTYNCEWSKLEHLILTPLKDRFGSRVSNGFVKVATSLESSRLTFNETVSVLKLISQEGLRFVLNLIYASSLYPKVNTEMRNISGGVGNKLSISKHYLTSQTRKYSELREVLDSMQGEGKPFSVLRSHSDDETALNLEGIEKSKESNRGFEEGETVPTRDRGEQVFNTVEITIGRPPTKSDSTNVIGTERETSTQLPYPALPNEGADSGHAAMLSSEGTDNRDILTFFGEAVTDTSKLIQIDPNIEVQLEAVQKRFDEAYRVYNDLKATANALQFVKNQLSTAPQDLKTYIRLTAEFDLSPSSLRDAGRMYHGVKKLTEQLDLANTTYWEQEFGNLEHLDRELEKINDQVVSFAKVMRTLGNDFKSGILPDTVNEDLRDLDIFITNFSELKTLKSDLKFLTAVETINQAAEFQNQYGKTLSKVNDYCRTHPNELKAVTGNLNADEARLTQLYTQSEEVQGALEVFNTNYNLVERAILNGRIQDYARFFAKRMETWEIICKMEPELTSSVRGIPIKRVKDSLARYNKLFDAQKKMLIAINKSYTEGYDLKQITQFLRRAEKFEATISQYTSEPNFQRLFKGFENTFAPVDHDFKALSNIVNGNFAFKDYFKRTVLTYAEALNTKLDEIKEKERLLYTSIKDEFPNVERSIWAQISEFFDNIWSWLSRI